MHIGYNAQTGIVGLPLANISVAIAKCNCTVHAAIAQVCWKVSTLQCSSRELKTPEPPLLHVQAGALNT